MSWSVNLVVKTGTPDIEEKIKAEFAKTSVPNDVERHFRDTICDLVTAVVVANNIDQFLKIDASGSTYDGRHVTKMSAEPIYGTLLVE